MSIRTLRFATSLALVALLIGWSGCSIGATAGDTKAAASGDTASVVITLVPVHPRLSDAVEAASTSASRAFMFMDRAVIKVVDIMNNRILMDESVNITGGMSGSQSTVTLKLPTDRSLQISAKAFNNKLSATAPSFAGETQITPRPSTGTTGMDENQCYINLLPINPPTLNYNSPVTTAALAPAIYDSAYYSIGPDGIANTQDDQRGLFVQNGAEYWTKFTATSETVSIVVTPSSYYLYASLYGEDGNYLSGGLSPSFSPPYTGGNAVSIATGLTAGSTYYLGFTPIATGTTANPGLPSTTVYLTLNSGTIAEDTSEPDDSFATAKDLVLNVNMGYANANANDPDWYRVYLSQTGSLTVTATSNAGYSNGIFGELLVMASDGTQVGRDSTESIGGGSVGKQSFMLTVPIPSPGYYYIQADFKGAHPQYNFPTVGGPYSLMVNLTQQVFAFVAPSVGQVRKGKLLSNPEKPGLLVYLYLDQVGQLYSVRSSDNGNTWSSSTSVPNQNYPVVDFAAEMDGNGTALYLGIEANVPNNNWNSVVGYLRNYDSYWYNYTLWYSGASLMAYPSVSRTSGGDVVFGYGYDMGGLNSADGAYAHSVYWSRYYQSFNSYDYVQLSYQTDNPWNNQVFSDSWNGDTYYMYQDNHYDWASMDIFATRAWSNPPYWGDYSEYLLVNAPSGSNASQPWMGRLDNSQLALVYLESSGTTSSLKYRTASSMYDLQYAADTQIDTSVAIENPWDQPDNNPVHKARTVYATVTPNGTMFVAYMKQDGGIYRSSITSVSVNAATYVAGGVDAQIDGLNVVVDGSTTVLYVSWHDSTGNHVERIANP